MRVSSEPSAACQSRSQPEAVDLMIELALNEFYRSHYQSVHTWAERAVSGAQVLGDPPLTAAALAVSALADAVTGAVERARSHHADAAALVDSLSDDELSRRLDAAAWLAAAELYLDLYAEADAHAAGRSASPARAGKASSSASCIRFWAESGACAASSPKPSSSSTGQSRRRGCRAIRRLLLGTSSTAPSSRSPSATWSSP